MHVIVPTLASQVIYLCLARIDVMPDPACATAQAQTQLSRSTSIAWPMPPATHIDSMP